MAAPLPEGVAPQLPALLDAAEAFAAPADIQAFAVAIDGLVTWAERFGVIPMETNAASRRQQVAGIVSSYREALADLPADLLSEAIKRTTSAHRYRTLPLPGDIRAIAEGEFRERHARLRRLRTAKMKADMEAKTRAAEPTGPRERTPEMIAAAEAMAADARRVLAAAKPHTMPAEPADLNPDQSDYRAARARVEQETRNRPLIPKPWDRPVKMEAAE